MKTFERRLEDIEDALGVSDEGDCQCTFAGLRTGIRVVQDLENTGNPDDWLPLSESHTEPNCRECGKPLTVVVLHYHSEETEA